MYWKIEGKLCPNHRGRSVGCPQGAVLIDGKAACGARFPIEAPYRHPCVERRLKGQDQLLKLVAGQAGEIQELGGARLQIGEP